MECITPQTNNSRIRFPIGAASWDHEGQNKMSKGIEFLVMPVMGVNCMKYHAISFRAFYYSYVIKSQSLCHPNKMGGVLS